MQKLLVVINGRQCQPSTVSFACHIAAITQSKLTGMFVENLYGKEDNSDADEEAHGQTAVATAMGKVVRNDTKEAITLFSKECTSHRLTAEIVISKGEPIQSVLRASRFADFMIVDPAVNFYGDIEQLPSHFTKEILAHSECPVLLAPEKPLHIEEIVFCYDGNASSVFAFKQFACLFAGLKNTKTLLLEVKSAAGDPADTSSEVLNWLQTHYGTVDYKILEGDAKDKLFAYFFKQENKLVVMGSYGRSALSNFFRRSAADILIRAVDLPIFIAHFNR